jgi:predicted nucleic acid-binding protein
VRILIDSNRFIDFCAGDAEVLEAFESAALLVIPFVVLAEIRIGALSLRQGAGQARVLNELLNQPGVRTIHSTDATTHHYAAIYAQLKRRGRPIPTNDIWIAALAIEHSLVLYSRDAHFDEIPSLARL